MNTPWPPAFEPLERLGSGHLQTLAGYCAVARPRPGPARQHPVTLADGDRVVLHENCPGGWRPAHRAALLVPGLGGSHETPYLVRTAAKLCRRGVRTFRMDQRGFGAAAGLARWPHHAGRSEDVAAALRAVDRLTGGAPTSLVGFSLGGNIALKLAGESPDLVPPNVTGVMAVNPPIDLAALIARLEHRSNRLYHGYFMRAVLRVVARRHRDAWPADAGFPCFRSSHEFNERFLAPVCGFGTARRYYELCSAAPYLPAVRLPALVLASRDDPLVPAHSFERARLSPSTRLAMTDRGGHLGYLGRAAPPDPDLRWMDWRVVDWATGPQAALARPPACGRGGPPDSAVASHGSRSGPEGHTDGSV
jgi:predicted alpha/beta-fold hydrolase